MMIFFQSCVLISREIGNAKYLHANVPERLAIIHRTYRTYTVCEKVDFCSCVELPAMTSDMIVKIGKKKFPSISEDKLQILADKSSGNIRTFYFQDLNH